MQYTIKYYIHIFNHSENCLRLNSKREALENIFLFYFIVKFVCNRNTI